MNEMIKPSESPLPGENRKGGTSSEGLGGSLLKSTGVVSMMTFLSRILGLARDVVIASLFGAGSGVDAFIVAFKIPNFFRRLFAEGAFSQAFVPVLSEYRTRRNHQSVKALVSYTAGSLGGGLLVITLLAVAAAPIIAMVFAPGFYQVPDKLSLAGEMLRITFPYLLLISLTAFAGSILNTYGRFGVPAFTPVMLNVSVITCGLFLAPLMDRPIFALAWGVLLAGIIQLAFQLPFLKRIDLMPLPRWGWKDEGVVRIRTLMIPALFGVSVAQVNLLLDTVLASFLHSGSVSWLYYSDRLMELPLGVFGIAIATVILPGLSLKHSQQSAKEFSQTLDWALRLVLLIGLPSAVALVVLAEPLLTTIFQYGEFSDNDVVMSAQSLRAYAGGLLGFMIIKILAPGYFARQDTKTPVIVGVKAMGFNMVFNLILVFPLAHAGLALATSIAAFVNGGMLYRGLRRDGVFTPRAGWVALLIRYAIANGVMALVLILLARPVEQWLAWDWRWRVLHLGFLVVAGAGAYVISLLVTGLKASHLRH